MRRGWRAVLFAAILLAELVLPSTSALAANQPPDPDVFATNLTVAEGQAATANGHVLDPDLDGVDLSTNIGTIYGAGPTLDGGFDWWWTWTTPDGPAVSDVTLTFSDPNGGSTDVPLHVTVSNAPPVVTVTGPKYVPIGKAYRTYSYNTQDVQADLFPDTVADCGTATFKALSTGTKTVDCDNWPAGSNTVNVTATDKDGAAGIGTATVVATPLVKRAEQMGTTIAGPATFGGALTVLDINGDGFNDLAVGPGSTFSGDPPPPYVATIRVFLGPLAGPSIDVTAGMGSAGFLITAADADDGFGRQIANAGDVNGDGADDLIVGARFADPGGRTNAGSAWVIFGSKGPSQDIDLASATATQAIRFDGTTAGDQLGGQVGNGSDLNADGFDDLVMVGGTAGGRTYLVPGSAHPAGGEISTVAATISGQAGGALRTGKVDGDQFADVVIASGGRVTIVYGAATLSDVNLQAPAPGTVSTIVESQYVTSAGHNNVGLADVNGDHLVDVVVGRTQLAGHVGAVIVYFGRADRSSRSGTTLGPADALHIRGDDATGYDVAIGDLDGDGHAEVLDLGWRHVDHGGGAAYVVAPTSFGADIDLSVLDGQWRRFEGGDFNWEPEDGDVAIGDVTGDGAPDAIVGWSPVSRVTILLGTVPPDTTDPTATAPVVSMPSGVGLSGGRVTTRLTWTGADAGSGVHHFQVQRSTDGGPYVSIGRSFAVVSATQQLAPGHSYRFRVRAIDAAGNVGEWVAGAAFKMTGIQQRARSVHRTGTWTTTPVDDSIWWGGTADHSSSKDATVSLTFTGRSIAWIGRMQPGRGMARVYVSGVLKATIDLGATSIAQDVVWSATYATSATRTITIKVLGNSARIGGTPRIDVDGFVVLS